MDESKAKVQSVGDRSRSLRSTGVRRNDDTLLDRQVLPDPAEDRWLLFLVSPVANPPNKKLSKGTYGVEVVNRDVEETLDLRCMLQASKYSITFLCYHQNNSRTYQIHGDDVVASRGLLSGKSVLPYDDPYRVTSRTGYLQSCSYNRRSVLAYVGFMGSRSKQLTQSAWPR